jgi:hypothetical protein
VTSTDPDAATDTRAVEAPDRAPVATPRSAWIALGVVLVIAAAVIIHAGRGVTFQIDEWQWIQGRTSPSVASLLEPFNNHWMSVPVGIHQVLYRLFGIGSHLPYRLALLAAHLGAAAVLFCYLRTRVRAWIALAATGVFALYGYAAAIIVWPISLGWALAVLCGIGALLLVDRRSTAGDVGAAIVLLVGVASTTIAVPFAIGLGVEMVVRRSWRRLWVPLAPLLVYGVWYLAYGGSSDAGGTVRQTLSFGEELLAQTVGTFLGIQDRGAAADATLVVVGIALVVSWFLLGRPVTPRLVGNATTLVVLSSALAIARGGTGLTTWYSYAVAASLLITAGELFSHAKAPSRLATGVVVVVALWAIAWNIGELDRITSGFRDISAAERAQLAALEVIQSDVAPEFEPGPLLQTLTAGRYRDVKAAFGTPAYTTAEALAAPRSARVAADETLVRGLEVTARPSTDAGAGAPAGTVTVRHGVEGTDASGCTVVRATDAGGDAVVDLRTGEPNVLLTARSGAASVRAGAFARASQPVGEVPSGATAIVSAPAVPAVGDWTLRVRSPGSVRLCAPSG